MYIRWPYELLPDMTQKLVWEGVLRKLAEVDPQSWGPIQTHLDNRLFWNGKNILAVLLKNWLQDKCFILTNGKYVSRLYWCSNDYLKNDHEGNFCWFYNFFLDSRPNFQYISYHVHSSRFYLSCTMVFPHLSDHTCMFCMSFLGIRKEKYRCYSRRFYIRFLRLFFKDMNTKP